jgi:hypothetical protein
MNVQPYIFRIELSSSATMFLKHVTSASPWFSYMYECDSRASTSYTQPRGRNHLQRIHIQISKQPCFLTCKRKSLMMQIKLYSMTEVMNLSACCTTAMPWQSHLISLHRTSLGLHQQKMHVQLPVYHQIIFRQLLNIETVNKFQHHILAKHLNLLNITFANVFQLADIYCTQSEVQIFVRLHQCP